MRVNNYVSYFRSIAVNHPLLLHDPASESGDSPATKHFTRVMVDEVITGLRTKVAFPALGLEMFELNNGRWRGAFMVFDHARDDYNDIIRALDITERIMRYLVPQVYQDTQNCRTPFEFADMLAADVISFGPVFDNEYGWRCEFGFRWKNEPLINVPLPELISAGEYNEDYNWDFNI